ncbi:MAG: hypothetical protein ACM3UU_00475 [Ignavibacteriales bacterium]
MSEKKIFCVNYSLPGDDDEYIPLESDRSLLDADIIIFNPGIPYNYHYNERYNGKPVLDQTYSFRSSEVILHWQRELKEAFDSGKTIFIFLSKPEEVCVYTGEKQSSGTGKSTVYTNIVRPLNSYDVFPVKIGKVIPVSGEEIRATKDIGVLSTYWGGFSKYSPFEIYLEGDFNSSLLTTKSGNKTVAAKFTNSKGAILIIPPIKYDENKFIKYIDEDEDEWEWTKEGKAFGKKYISCLIEIDKAIKKGAAVSPLPAWAKDRKFRLGIENKLTEKISIINDKIEKLKEQKTNIEVEIEKEGLLRGLLYEQGKPLELSIIHALEILGFKAEGFQNDESEFDVVFVGDEGRFIGEAEGRDNKAINIEKLSQLERNIQEDFARDEVNEYAKGVLFGNAYRLLSPEERTEFFTEKCFSGAKRSNIALIRTIDLFNVAKYIKDTKDSKFSKECRKAIKNTSGEIVNFPEISVNDEEATKEKLKKVRCKD